MSNLKEIHISIEELVFRVAAATRCSMNEKFSDDLIGYGWQVPEEDFLSDVQRYVGEDFEDGDVINKEIVEQKIIEGLFNLETFMLDFYEVDYAGENEDGEEEEFSGTLYECMQKFNIASFRKEWKMEDISANWEGFDVFIFNDSASEESYDDILENYSNH
jgi:hypothetical protein